MNVLVTRVTLVTLLISIGTALHAQSVDIPLSNWTVPPYTGGPSTGGGIRTMADQTPPRAFIGLQVCRLVDTRGNPAVPFHLGGPFAADEIRTYNFQDFCGIAVGVEALSLNITATNTGPQPFGHVKIWPGNQPEPNVSTLNYPGPGATVANAAIVGLSPTGELNIKSGNAGADIIVDVNGYFSDTWGTFTNSFRLESNGPVPTLRVLNHWSQCIEGCAVSATALTNSTGYAVWGLYGGNGTGGGVFGSSPGGDPASAGVRGESTYGYGVHGDSYYGNGLRGTSRDGTAVTGYTQGLGPYVVPVAGVYGQGGIFQEGDYGIRHGGRFVSFSTTLGSAGVRGEWGIVMPAGETLNSPAGVLGLSRDSYGVLGICEVGICEGAVAGRRYDSTGTIASAGYLGAATAGVRFVNGLVGTGTKSFVEPHPTDASKSIRYVSLEGNEAGTYFRGRGKFDRGIATIEVPEDFRMVTAEEGLGIQVTPIGEMATVAVAHIGLDRIVVRGSRNVEFFYTVNGVRRAYPQWTPVVPNEEFIPDSAAATLPRYLSENEQQRLIANGTYNPDRTINLETARRLGWDRIWEEKQHRTGSQPAK